MLIFGKCYYFPQIYYNGKQKYAKVHVFYYEDYISVVVSICASVLNMVALNINQVLSFAPAVIEFDAAALQDVEQNSPETHLCGRYWIHFHFV